MKIELNEQFKKALAAMEKSHRHVFVTGQKGIGLKLTKSPLCSIFLSKEGDYA